MANVNPEDKDVVSFGDDLCKISKLRKSIYNSLDELANKFHDSVLDGTNINAENIPIASDYREWFDKGVDCEILQLGSKDWKKGKIKVNFTIEFCPDEPEEKQPESPLDDIRKMINENNNI
jgi:hypothetical protein